LSEIEHAGSFGGAIWASHQRLGARGFGQREDMLTVAIDANALELAQFGGFAAQALERVQQLAFLSVWRRAQSIDGVTDATRLRLLVGGGAQRTLAEAEREESERANQSAAFGGGPIWMRSPMYAPIKVKSTPSTESSTYMKAGIVFTV
jgi:hypothetical protein